MSESRMAERECQGGGRPIRLSIYLPLVFLIGVPTILITRAIFFYYYPENFFTVAARYFVAAFFLAYPMTIYAELRRPFREFVATARMD